MFRSAATQGRPRSANRLVDNYGAVATGTGSVRTRATISGFNPPALSAGWPWNGPRHNRLLIIARSSQSHPTLARVWGCVAGRELANLPRAEGAALSIVHAGGGKGTDWAGIRTERTDLLQDLQEPGAGGRKDYFPLDFEDRSDATRPDG